MKVHDCIGCGFCCHKAPCSVGHKLHGVVALCPELLFADGRHWCQWVMKQELISEERGIWALEVLGINEGCCSNLNSWRREEIVDRTEREPNMQNIGLWGCILRGHP